MLTEGIFNSFNTSMKMVSAKKNVSVIALADDNKKDAARAHVFQTKAKDFYTIQNYGKKCSDQVQYRLQQIMKMKCSE